MQIIETKCPGCKHKMEFGLPKEIKTCKNCHEWVFILAAIGQPAIPKNFTEAWDYVQVTAD